MRAARLTIGPALESLPYGELFRVHLPNLSGPFGVFSRLVVRKDERRTGLARCFDDARLASAIEAGVAYIFMIAEPLRAAQVASLGFEPIGPNCRLEPWKNSENIPLAARIYRPNSRSSQPC